MRMLSRYAPALGGAVLLHAVLVLTGQIFLSAPSDREQGRAFPRVSSVSVLISLTPERSGDSLTAREQVSAGTRSRIPPLKSAANEAFSRSVRSLAEHYTSRLAGDDRYRKPRPVNAINPPYPPGAKLRKEQGVVLYRVSVNADGKIDGIELVRSSGFPVLDQAAREAVMRTAFVPAFWMNRPLADQVTIRIKFELKQ